MTGVELIQALLKRPDLLERDVVLKGSRLAGKKLEGVPWGSITLAYGRNIYCIGVKEK